MLLLDCLLPLLLPLLLLLLLWLVLLGWRHVRRTLPLLLLRGHSRNSVGTLDRSNSRGLLLGGLASVCRLCSAWLWLQQAHFQVTLRTDEFFWCRLYELGSVVVGMQCWRCVNCSTVAHRPQHLATCHGFMVLHLHFGDHFARGHNAA